MLPEVGLLLSSFSNNRTALCILLAVVPTTTLAYVSTLILPAVVVIVLTAAITVGICVMAMLQHESQNRGASGARQLMSSLLERQVLSGKRLAIVDPETMLFKRWYFDLRLSEEINRCKRYGSRMSVLGLKRVDTRDADGASAGETELDFVQAFSRNLRALDLATRVGQGQYCVCLPHTDKTGGDSVASRLINGFGGGRIAISVVEYAAEDGAVGDRLMERAMASASVSAMWQDVREPGAVEAPLPIDAVEVVAGLRLAESDEIRLAPGESAKSVKAKLRREAKKAGIAVTISEHDGVIEIRRASQAKPDKVAA